MARKTPPFRQIRKRDASVVPFDAKRIESAIGKALLSTNSGDDRLAAELTTSVLTLAATRIEDKVPTVEQIQDIVEEVLMHRGLASAARAYILYRHEHSQRREAKRLIGVRDELKLTVNAIKVLERRYLRRDDQGRICETPEQMFQRVARAVAEPEASYTSRAEARRWEKEFLGAMARLDFLPNSPTLMNAGTPMGQLSACFVLPVDDSIQSIFQALSQMAQIHQTGGGTGFSFSRLRPRNDVVGSTHGVASGPVSFMRVFDTATEVIKQGGRRRGANMGALRVDHPDIFEFIESKVGARNLRNFNISVAATDAFMKAVESDRQYRLVSPRTGKPVETISARTVFDLICASAWKSGDPGMLFIDQINRRNPTPKLGKIEATNPCGELPLLPYESCNLGSINLAHMMTDGAIDWNKLRRTVEIGVRFLDNVIDANRYIIPDVKEITRANRKTGLGVMGFADLLVALGVPYDSTEALGLAERIMRAVSREARRVSAALAEERGEFPNWKLSRYARRGTKLRNATVTTVAPTGTISILAGCSSGIEPIFALSFVRNVMEGARLLEVHPTFERIARERGFYSSDLMAEIARRGSLRGIKGVPKDVGRVFVTAFDIPPRYHIHMQAAFQRHCDNSVSKTVNLPKDATVDDVKKIFRLAYELKCKGVTVYRYGSRTGQVLQFPGAEKVPEGLREPTSVDSEYSGGCPSPKCTY
ncbi:MAG: adenosylcobalamin-dependent ribonucleoside-diphosphate reductase [Planctomycetes bacterium]|nr:adenosylcobalamin-dependent ribonucleoside-diphosphate reductase [Planctomycetota bacterium]